VCLLRPRNQTTDAGDREPELLGDGAHGQATFGVRPKQGLFAAVTVSQPLGKAARRAALRFGDLACGLALRVSSFCMRSTKASSPR